MFTLKNLSHLLRLQTRHVVKTNLLNNTNKLSSSSLQISKNFSTVISVDREYILILLPLSHFLNLKIHYIFQ